MSQDNLEAILGLVLLIFLIWSFFKILRTFREMADDVKTIVTPPRELHVHQQSATYADPNKIIHGRRTTVYSHRGLRRRANLCAILLIITYLTVYPIIYTFVLDFVRSHNNFWVWGSGFAIWFIVGWIVVVLTLGTKRFKYMAENQKTSKELEGLYGRIGIGGIVGLIVGWLIANH